jgi:hypothetical protein
MATFSGHECMATSSYALDESTPDMQVDGHLQPDIINCTLKLAQGRILRISGVPVSQRRHLVRLGLRLSADGSTLVLVTSSAPLAQVQQQQKQQQQRELQQLLDAVHHNRVDMPPLLLGSTDGVQLARASDVAALLGVDTAALQQGGVTRTVQLEVSSAVGQV